MSWTRVCSGSRVTVAVAFTLLVLFFTTSRHELAHYGAKFGISYGTAITCPQSSLANDILVVLKTGANERDRWPALSETTLRCIPRYMVVSDVEEEVDGMYIEDILYNYDDQTQGKNKEFNYYRQLQNLRATGTPFSTALDPVFHKEDSGAWALDKWKFVPMIHRAAAEPAKWYVFIEADTYLVWSNLLQFLDRFNPDDAHYFGSPAWLEDQQVFAHSGSGIVLSASVVRAVSEYSNAHAAEVVEFTADRCCGDEILGELINLAGTRLTQSWPSMQGETPLTLDYTERHWCYPVVSYHHMTAEEIRLVWDYEQTAQKRGKPFTHRDVFEALVRPSLVDTRAAWDNMSPRRVEGGRHWVDGAEDGLTVRQCARACGDDERCLQWLWESYSDSGRRRSAKRSAKSATTASDSTEPDANPDLAANDVGDCRLGDVLRFGKPAPPGDAFTSGYDLARIEAYISRLGTCAEIAWPA